MLLATARDHRGTICSLSFCLSVVPCCAFQALPPPRPATQTPTIACVGHYASRADAGDAISSAVCIYTHCTLYTCTSIHLYAIRRRRLLPCGWNPSVRGHHESHNRATYVLCYEVVKACQDTRKTEAGRAFPAPLGPASVQCVGQGFANLGPLLAHVANGANLKAIYHWDEYRRSPV